MKNYIIKKFLISSRLNALDEKKRFYEKAIEDSEIVERQIHRFNTVWEQCYTSIPFYKQWRKKYKLPSRISTLNDLQDFPLLTKRVIQEHKDIIFHDGKIKQYVSTGGSTGEPTRFPSLPKDAITTYADLYVGRSWWGIQPLDSMLLFWGHSHLFGTGFRGKVNHYKRKAYDYLFNMKRLNAYDMTAETTKKYFDIYFRCNPCFIVGYASCVYQLAKYIDENMLDCGRKDNLKAVIVTSETVSEYDIDFLQKVFGVAVVIEYGMAETGVIAYSYKNTWNIKIFWDSFIATTDTQNILNITTICDRAFPLINYNTEDIVKIGDRVQGSVLQVSSILGRKRDILRIGTVTGSHLELSGILMVHILKSYPHIFSVQFEQLKYNSIQIFLVASCSLDLQDTKKFFLSEIRKTCRDIDPNCIDIVQVSAAQKALSGKENMIRSQKF